MISANIEKIKEEYTDKYVVVDTNRPELARFRDHVGQVKTVNMSGRALVEFMEFHLNIGWHDIDLDYLKVVDKPAPQEKKPAAKKPAAKPAAKKAAPAGEKKLSPLEMARAQDAGAKGAATKEKPAAKPAAKKKMSVAEMMAAARAETAGGDAPAAEVAPPEPKAAPEPVAEEPAPAEEVAEAPAAASDDGVVKVDRASMSVEEMIAYCREKDAE